MLKVKGRLLPSPTIAYAHAKTVPSKYSRSGSWNLRAVQFVDPATNVGGWSILEISRSRTSSVSDKSMDWYFDNLGPTMEQYGIRGARAIRFKGVDRGRHRLFLENQPDHAQQDFSDENEISKRLEQFQKHCNARLMFVFLPSKDAALYSTVKRVGDVKLGLATICSVSQTCNKGRDDEYWGPKCDDMTRANWMLKVNIKMGGVNHTLQKGSQPIITERTMFMGKKDTPDVPINADLHC